jgi:gas vesicle protein
MSKIITALFAGIAIGILVAPRKGSETRKKIRDGISDMRDDINDFFHDTVENLKSGLSSAEGHADDFLQSGKEQFSSLGKKF